MCSLQNDTWTNDKWMNVFFIEGILYRICSLQNLFSTESVLYWMTILWMCVFTALKTPIWNVCHIIIHVWWCDIWMCVFTALKTPIRKKHNKTNLKVFSFFPTLMFRRTFECANIHTCAGGLQFCRRRRRAAKTLSWWGQRSAHECDPCEAGTHINVWDCLPVHIIVLMQENTFYSNRTHSTARTHSSDLRECLPVHVIVLMQENTFYSNRTHSIAREHLLLTCASVWQYLFIESEAAPQNTVGECIKVYAYMCVYMWWVYKGIYVYECIYVVGV